MRTIATARPNLKLTPRSEAKEQDATQLKTEKHTENNTVHQINSSRPRRPTKKQPQRPHQMSESLHMFGNPHHSQIQGTNSSSQQQAYAVHLAKERQMQQHMAPQQHSDLSGASALPNVQNSTQILQQNQASSANPVPCSKPQHQRQQATRHELKEQGRGFLTSATSESGIDIGGAEVAEHLAELAPAKHATIPRLSPTLAPCGLCERERGSPQPSPFPPESRRVRDQGFPTPGHRRLTGSPHRPPPWPRPALAASPIPPATGAAARDQHLVSPTLALPVRRAASSGPGRPMQARSGRPPASPGGLCLAWTPGDFSQIRESRGLTQPQYKSNQNTREQNGTVGNVAAAAASNNTAIAASNNTAVAAASSDKAAAAEDKAAATVDNATNTDAAAAGKATGTAGGGGGKATTTAITRN
ncbi:unnamed protein product [Miscanthus lutarioriparius]|uniref:Uncharacterized protein n=1 Tax=Miscanthus lutarioriparius TaxID=422564 RepID=A0A811R5R6_9POAL|nr:unnamed protein product [Miscanthus lutarioriparius]